jgi:hypothetical protein
MTVLHQKEYEEAIIIMNEILQRLGGEKKLTVDILSELLFLAIHELGETTVDVFKEACVNMSKNYEKNHGTILKMTKKT